MKDKTLKELIGIIVAHGGICFLVNHSSSMKCKTATDEVLRRFAEKDAEIAVLKRAIINLHHDACAVIAHRRDGCLLPMWDYATQARKELADA